MLKASAEKLIKAIDRSRKEATLTRLLIAIGIPLVGAEAARKIAYRFEDLSDLLKQDPEWLAKDLVKIDGIGKKIAQSVADFLGDKRQRAVLEKLLKYGVDPPSSEFVDTETAEISTMNDWKKQTLTFAQLKVITLGFCECGGREPMDDEVCAACMVWHTAEFISKLPNKLKKAKVISGFPATGKTYYKYKSNLSVLDSDSSKFSWVRTGVRHPDFPQNYIKYIKENLNKVDIILVSSHKVVRDALVKNKINFTLVFPERSLKEEYIKRFQTRGNDQNFINMLHNNWDSFIDEMENQEKCKIIRLAAGEFLTNCLEE